MTIVPENEILNLCFLVSWNPFRVLDFVFRAGSKIFNLLPNFFQVYKCSFEIFAPRKP